MSHKTHHSSDVNWLPIEGSVEGELKVVGGSGLLMELPMGGSDELPAVGGK